MSEPALERGAADAPRAANYLLVRRVFLTLLGATFLIAFSSLVKFSIANSNVSRISSRFSTALAIPGSSTVPLEIAIELS